MANNAMKELRWLRNIVRALGMLKRWGVYSISTRGGHAVRKSFVGLSAQLTGVETPGGPRLGCRDLACAERIRSSLDRLATRQEHQRLAFSRWRYGATLIVMEFSDCAEPIRRFPCSRYGAVADGIGMLT